jgi:hypothetical protein
LNWGIYKGASPGVAPLFERVASDIQRLVIGRAISDE